MLAGLLQIRVGLDPEPKRRPLKHRAREPADQLRGLVYTRQPRRTWPALTECGRRRDDGDIDWIERFVGREEHHSIPARIPDRISCKPN